MNFSDSLPQNGGLVVYSFDSAFVAVAKAFEVKIFETNTLRPITTFQFVDISTSVEWSKDSQFILVGVHKRGVAFVRNIQDPTWNCKIDEGINGLSYCAFAATSKHVVTISESKLRLTIWSLSNKSVQYIQYPKHDDKGVAFSDDSKLMAVVLRSHLETDSIAVYKIGRDSAPWECLI